MSPADAAGGDARCVEEALALLGVRNLVLGVHDASLPADPDGDVGHGAPGSRSSERFFRFASHLGFNGLQFGPQGLASGDAPSPYESAVFARSEASIALGALASEAWRTLLRSETLAALVAARPPGSETRACHGAARGAVRRALGEAWQTLETRRTGADARGLQPLLEALSIFEREHAQWLERDLVFEAALAEHGHDDWPRWGGAPDAALDPRLFAPHAGEEAACEARRRELLARHARRVTLARFAQFVAHEQHHALRRLAAELRLRLFGDLQIGLAHRDVWSWQAYLLQGYLLGAPPSRTNPEGQAWGYRLLDPARERAAPGLLARRMDKLFSEFDGVRIDHPHGWVCPWVYRADGSDPLDAVRHGARLFASPDLPDHPALASYAIVRREQLNRDPSTPRHADDWVVSLEPEQVERYARFFDVIVGTARRHEREPADLPCEVLSTCPHPLRRVLERHGLGRFRVTQKADPGDDADPYHPENAAEPDWMMVGNHDTPTLWSLLPRWVSDASAPARVARLARRLEPRPERREGFAERLRREPAFLAHSAVAELFVSPARNVMIFFTDLVGSSEPYNRPGVRSPENWTQRIPPDWERVLPERLAAGRALDLGLCLRLALGACDRDAKRVHGPLLRRLEHRSRTLAGARPAPA